MTTDTIVILLGIVICFWLLNNKINYMLSVLLFPIREMIEKEILRMEKERDDDNS